VTQQVLKWNIQLDREKHRNKLEYASHAFIALKQGARAKLLLKEELTAPAE